MICCRRPGPCPLSLLFASTAVVVVVTASIVARPAWRQRRAIQTLIDAIDDTLDDHGDGPQIEVRWYTKPIVKSGATQAAIDRLLPLLSSDRESVREYASYAVSDLADDPEGIQHLVTVLRNADRVTQEKTVAALSDPNPKQAEFIAKSIGL